MQTHAHAVDTGLGPRRVETARVQTAEPRGSAAITVFYLVAALACLAVVVAAGIVAAV